MNGSEFVRAGKRLMQFVWDPPPKNEDEAPIWCLGERYQSHPTHTNTDAHDSPPPSASTSSHVDSKLSTTSDEDKQPRLSTTSAGDEGFEKVEAQDEGLDNGWPAAFLDDVESRIWLTYRQDFAPIATSPDPKAASAMSFSTRIKMLGSKGAFNSDTGWGCMIRSGQSLLANTLAMLELGRGDYTFSFPHSTFLAPSPFFPSPYLSRFFSHLPPPFSPSSPTILTTIFDRLA